MSRCNVAYVGVGHWRYGDWVSVGNHILLQPKSPFGSLVPFFTYLYQKSKYSIPIGFILLTTPIIQLDRSISWQHQKPPKKSGMKPAATVAPCNTRPRSQTSKSRKPWVAIAPCAPRTATWMFILFERILFSTKEKTTWRTIASEEGRRVTCSVPLAALHSWLIFTTRWGMSLMEMRWHWTWDFFDSDAFIWRCCWLWEGADVQGCWYQQAWPKAFWRTESPMKDFRCRCAGHLTMAELDSSIQDWFDKAPLTYQRVASYWHTVHCYIHSHPTLQAQIV